MSLANNSNSQQQLSSVAAPPPQPVTYGNWTEYFDDASGKFYYHQNITKECVWEAPEEFRVEKARAEVKKLFDPSIKKTASLTVVPKEEPMDVSKEVDMEEDETPVEPPEDDEEKYKKMTKAEQVAAFKDLLRSSEITPKMKWNEAMKLVINAPAWRALPTVGEKKQAFAEFTTQLANELNVAKRRKQKTARENFLKLLAGNDKITSNTRWMDLLDENLGLTTDERWKDVEDDAERRDLFSTYITDLSRTEREFKRQQRDVNRRAVLAFLRDAAPAAGITITASTRFHEVRAALEEAEPIKKLDLHRMDLQDWVMEHIQILHRDEEEKLREERKRLREREDELAASFKAFLEEEVSAKRLTTASRWRDCWAGYESNPTYCDLKKINSKMPRDIFEALMDRLHDALREERALFKHVLDATEFVMKYNSTLSAFVQHVRKEVERMLANARDDRPNPASPSVRHNFLTALLDESTVPPSVLEWFEKTHAGELDRYKRVEGERLKKVEAFEEMLMEYYFRSDHLSISWEQAKGEIQHRSAFRALDDGAEVAFQQYMQKLQKKMESLSKTRKAVEATGTFLTDVNIIVCAFLDDVCRAQQPRGGAKQQRAIAVSIAQAQAQVIAIRIEGPTQEEQEKQEEQQVV
ncbi:Aste57867_19786 [Aphanomyces stellatus]|uniref:Aste57867_19786 protein n=1 Tax=Aphanomyces stellatus TaxID=120398 RepID=A0A485LD90_9STRA|nr:hypothetical protein As57867_019721 [Aphanomyces stellatus]VFT96484.1 Aste57867_19786 [Aphanomyces stellatus]